MLFIIIHQTYELWFKQILHEVPDSSVFSALEVFLTACFVSVEQLYALFWSALNDR